MRDALKRIPAGEFKVPEAIQFVSTPHGLIPYKPRTIGHMASFAEQNGETENIYGGAYEVLDSNYKESASDRAYEEPENDSNYKGIPSESGAEIDFLIRR